jgi:hypothetical protein
MSRIILITALILSSQVLYAQKKPVISEYATIDRKALQLPDSLTKSTESMASYINANFQNDKEKSRAIFIWLTTNIQYDIENMFAINFYEKKEDKIAKPLKTRKGICENYAVLFNDLCLKVGIESFVIEGYTKQNGFADFIPHAWCAALIDNFWFMFDPTWGSGYVDEGKFYRKINNKYFKVDPSILIESHIPFDYLWQFLNYPITNQEFYEGKTQPNKTKPFFNFTDSIRIYSKQNHIEQLSSSAYRIEKNGIKNSLIFDRLQHIKLEIETDRQNKAVNLYNSAVNDYNRGVKALNNFINYRNNQFNPKKADTEIQNMIDSADVKLEKASAKLNSIENPGTNIMEVGSQLAQSIKDAETQLSEQQNWLRIYFTKGKSGRKSMFYDRKITWLGIPLN